MSVFTFVLPVVLSAGEEKAEKLKALRQLERELPTPAEAPPEIVTPPRTPPKPPPPPKARQIRPGAEQEAEFITRGAASGGFGGDGRVWWANRYFFRGVRFSRNDVLQARLSLWYKRFSVRGFFTYDFGPDQLNEIDGTISYTYPVSNDAAIEGGYTYYGYPHRAFDDTQEVFAGIRQQWYADVSVYGYWDFDEGEGALWEFSAGKNFRYEFIDPYVRATAVLNGRYFNEDIEFSHGLFTVGLPLLLGDHVVLRADFTYQWGWQGWVEDSWYVTAGAGVRF